MLPSVKTLTTLTERYTGSINNPLSDLPPVHRAVMIRRILEADNRDTLLDMLESGNYPVTRDWVRSCYHPPAFQYLKIKMIDELLGLHGVEYQKSGRGSKSPAFDYCNAGDAYNPTLMYIHGRGYRVACWGDIVEHGNYE